MWYGLQCGIVYNSTFVIYCTAAHVIVVMVTLDPAILALVVVLEHLLLLAYCLQ